MIKASDFDKTVPLPPGLDIPAFRKSIEYIERELPDPIEIYFEQMNVFSTVVGIYGARALDVHSVYVKSRHIDKAQQRFPDLKRKGASDPPPPELALESKGSKRPWELQAHYDHPGWYVVWRYLVDPTQKNRPIIIWRVDVAFLKKDDWKYEASTASALGGGRTHTFGLKKAAQRLQGCQVYQRSDIRLRGGKPVPKNGDSN